MRVSFAMVSLLPMINHIVSETITSPDKSCIERDGKRYLAWHTGPVPCDDINCPVWVDLTKSRPQPPKIEHCMKCCVRTPLAVTEKRIDSLRTCNETINGIKKNGSEELQKWKKKVEECRKTSDERILRYTIPVATMVLLLVVSLIFNVVLFMRIRSSKLTLSDVEKLSLKENTHPPHRGTTTVPQPPLQALDPEFRNDEADCAVDL